MASAASRIVRNRRCWRYRAQVAGRVLAGTLGAYALAAALAIAVARITPLASIDAAMLGTLVALCVFPAVTLWAFLTRSVGRALAGIAGLALVLGALAWFVGPMA